MPEARRMTAPAANIAQVADNSEPWLGRRSGLPASSVKARKKGVLKSLLAKIEWTPPLLNFSIQLLGFAA